MELDKISAAEEAKETEELRKSVSAPSKLDCEEPAPTPAPRAHINYKENMKKALFWVHYGIFLIIILVSIYSIIAGSLTSHEDAKKEHDLKVTNVIQGLYKLIHMVNHLPNIGPIGVNGDPLDDLNRNIAELLDKGVNVTERSKGVV